MWRDALLIAVFCGVAGCSGTPADYTAKELYARFQQEKAVPLAGQTISVRGRIDMIDNSWMLPPDWKFVTISGRGMKAGEWVFCCFAPEKTPQLEGLREGYTVVIRGRWAGRHGLDCRVPMLAECELVE